MGIPGFYVWLKKTYKSCFVPPNSKHIYDYIHIDVNYLLHTCLTGISTERGFRSRLFQSLDMVLCNFTPTKGVTLAVDGTPPYSKILLQRSRRLASANNTDVSKLCPLHLTTGTQFMSKVDIWLDEYAQRMTHMFKHIKVHFTVVPTTKPGEGEIKIFERMVQIGQSKRYLSHLIVGNDADLTVLASAASPIDNIHMLIRDSAGRTELFSIYKMSQQLATYLGKDRYLTPHVWRTDFAVLSIMMGNDYLPKVNYIKFEMLWEVYKYTVNSILVNSILVNSNKNSLVTNFKGEPRLSRTFLNELASNLIKAIPNKGYRALNIHKYDENRVRCYLEGLLWCLQMYQTGVCPMYDYIYDYNTSVSPTDILFFVESYDVSQIEVPRSNTPAISNKVFPLLVMPKKGQSLVHNEYRGLMDKQLKHLYQTEGCAKCLDLRSQLSVQHKALIAIRKGLAGQDGLAAEEDKIKKLLKIAHQELMKHKTEHLGGFTAQDILKIVSLTSR